MVGGFVYLMGEFYKYSHIKPTIACFKILEVYDNHVYVEDQNKMTWYIVKSAIK